MKESTCCALSAYEKSIAHEVRDSLMRHLGYSSGWCGYCSYLLRCILRHGYITSGDVCRLPCNKYPSGHWWLEFTEPLDPLAFQRIPEHNRLELDEPADPYILDITGDQFNHILGDLKLPDVVMGDRGSYKVYRFGRRESFINFGQNWIHPISSPGLRGFYEEMNEKYPSPEIATILRRRDNENQ